MVVILIMVAEFHRILLIPETNIHRLQDISLQLILKYYDDKKINKTKLNAVITLCLGLLLMCILLMGASEIQDFLVNHIDTTTMIKVFFLYINPMSYLTMFVLNAIVLIVSTYFVIKMTGMSLYELNIRFKFGFKDLIFYCLTYLIVIMCLVAAWNIFHYNFGVSFTDVMNQFDPGNLRDNSFNFFTPFYEEYFFRGLFLALLLRAGLNWFWAIIVSAVIFMGMHAFSRLDYPIILRNTLILSMIVGVLTGYMFYKSKSLVGGMVLHFLINMSLALICGNREASSKLFDRLLF